MRVCQEVRADLIELPDGQCRSDHEPFQDWYATPIHKVNGPQWLAELRGQGALGWCRSAEDGSASFDVPAGKCSTFEVLDDQFNELQRMRSVVQLQPGEKRSCIGCHENRRTTHLPRALPPAAPESPTCSRRPGEPDRFAYEQVVQPVWDTTLHQLPRHEDEHGINLTGTLDADNVPASFRTLIAGGWVHYFDYKWNLRHHKAAPKSFGTLQSKLMPRLETEHHGVSLSEHELRAIKCWIDLNCPLWPDYQFRLDRKEPLAGQAAE